MAKKIGLPNRKKLPKRAAELWDALECTISTGAGYNKYLDNRKLPLKTVVNSIIMVLAGSGSLEPELHDQFAKAGYIAPKEQIEAFQKWERIRRALSSN